MAGNNRMVLQPRDLQLLRELAVMRIADREQIKAIASFGSTTRANARLLALTRAGLLRRFFLGSGGGRRALYALSIKGAQLAQVPYRGPRRPQDALLVADFFVQHQLTVNEFYCRLKCKPIPASRVSFLRWLSFHQPIVTGLSLIPDGYVEFQSGSEVAACFLEVDLGHESLTVWKEKAAHYLQLAVSGEFQKQFTQVRFRVLVIVNSERRLHSIRKAVSGITEKIFWFANLESVRENFFASVWYRSTDNQPKPLFEEHL